MVIENKGRIFGGCIRDFISGIEPIDISIPDGNIQKFNKEISKQGYTPTNNLSNKFIKENDPNSFILDIIELPDGSEFKVEFNVYPDFDVNLMAWDGSVLFNYLNPT